MKIKDKLVYFFAVKIGLWKKYVYFLFFPLAILFMEFTVKLYAYGKIFDKGFFYTLIFSVVTGLVCALLSSIWSRKANLIIGLILLGSITFVFVIQVGCYTIMKFFASIYMLKMAVPAITGFTKEALTGIVKSLVPAGILLIPFVLYLIFAKKLIPEKKLRPKSVFLLLGIALMLQLGNVAIIKNDNLGIMPSDYIYSQRFQPSLSVPRFGILTTLRLDIQSVLRNEINIDLPSLHKPPETTGGPPDEQENPQSNPADMTGGKNVLEIDFDKLIKNETNHDIADMHAYFSSLTPTSKNEYTGMFEGYNLIWIVAESFSRYALDETHTPTLSKLANEGFVFNNYYHYLWTGSTSTGEYVTSTGLIPTDTGVLSFEKSAENYMPFAFGTIFSNLGYSARAYHNHDYTYYERDKIYPNLGYEYKGVGNGLEKFVTEQWPESDVEMIAGTIPEYVKDENFMVYYLTVSGHVNYNFYGNAMAVKHESAVADLPYSENPRAYIATQMEFDQAIALLIDELDKAGVLDNTFIVISGDHYPYGLEHDEIEELAGERVDPDFELYRSTLIMWNPKMERVEVDKYCSSLDIMPTLANLFGLPYDSRLVSGSDIFSDSDALIVFENTSFITDLGRYNAYEDVFYPNEGIDLPDNYARDMFYKVSDMFYYAAKILDNDYYAKVFKKSR